MNYQIKDYKPLNIGTLRGSFVMEIGPFRVEGFTYHVKDGKSWVSFPAREYQDDDGKRKFHPIIRILNKDRYGKFQNWCLSQLKDVFTNSPAPAANVDESGVPF